jgi:hypothetical protein
MALRYISSRMTTAVARRRKRILPAPRDPSRANRCGADHVATTDRHFFRLATTMLAAVPASKAHQGRSPIVLVKLLW